MKRKLKLLVTLTEQLCDKIDEHIEMFIEERPWLWKEAGIEKALENLLDKKKGNELEQKMLIEELEKIKNDL